MRVERAVPQGRARRLGFVLVALGLSALGSLAPPLLDARPGGGHSYSGGGSSSGGSGGGSGSSGGSGGRSSGYSGGSSSGSSSSSSSSYSSSISEVPQPLFIVLFGGVFGLMALALAGHVVMGVMEKIDNIRDRYSDNWQSRPVPPPEPHAPKELWQFVREADPDFSAVLFEDFAYGLYAAAHRARHDAAALARLRPYLEPRVQAALHAGAAPGAPVLSVIVGAMRVLRVVVAGAQEHRAIVEIESNITVQDAEGARGEYLRERWIFARASTTSTRPWKGTRTFDCPSCGAPYASTAEDECASCGQAAGSGRFDWRVISAQCLEQKPRMPSLTGTVAEQGTHAPTVVDPAATSTFQALMQDDATVVQTALFARAAAIFGRLQEAWAAQDLATVRPYVSDGLFNYLQYWVEAYKAQGLLNAVEGARITRQQLAKVTRDRHYDAVTLRIWATGHEVTTEKATGRVVGGSRVKERAYSEYWTLIRGAGVRGAPKTDPVCPSCAAPLAINMAGHCDHCGVHVTSGEFDWVLSRIEQDDSYTG